MNGATGDPTARQSVPSRWWDVAAGGVPFYLYLLTVAPTVYGLDSAELTTGAYALGIVHAPGSPLYLLLGHLFTYLPVGDVGYRLNLMAAVSAALGVWFLFRTMLVLTREALPALGAAWLLAFSYYFWVSAVAAELYSLHACIVAGLLWLALVWCERGRPWQLLLFTFCFGLGLGNHLSLALLAPGFAVIVLAASVPQPRFARLADGTSALPVWRRPGLMALAALCGVLGASVYVYLPIRHLANAELNYARDYWGVNLATGSGFWWMVTARMFRWFFGAATGNLSTELIVYLHRLNSNFINLGVPLGLVGLIALIVRRPAFGIGLVLMFAGHLAFFLTYGVIDKEVMFLPTYVVWGIWVGVGAQALGQPLVRWGGPGYASLAPLLLLLLATSNIALNFRLVDLSSDWTARERGERIFAALEPNAVFLGSWGDVPILEYLQIVEGRRRDVEALNLIFLDRRRVSIAKQRLAAGRPVYTSALHMLGDELRYEAVAPCRCSRLRLREPPPTPTAAPP